jgi:hypothetical protein
VRLRIVPFCRDVDLELTIGLTDIIILFLQHRRSQGTDAMTDTDTQIDEKGSSFGCWGIMLIGAIVVAVAVIGFFVLV